jgi:prefoldin alpha subunit
MMAKSSLAELEGSSDNNALLIPLNSSLYVPGNLTDSGRVVVELGTGYFAEKSIEDAVAMIDRKLQLVAKSIESVESVGMQKTRTLEVLSNVMNYKMQQQENK